MFRSKIHLKLIFIYSDGLLYTFKPNNVFRSVIFKINICGSEINQTVYLHVKSLRWQFRALKMLSHMYFLIWFFQQAQGEAGRAADLMFRGLKDSPVLSTFQHYIFILAVHLKHMQILKGKHKCFHSFCFVLRMKRCKFWKFVKYYFIYFTIAEVREGAFQNIPRQIT